MFMNSIGWTITLFHKKIAQLIIIYEKKHLNQSKKKWKKSEVKVEGEGKRRMKRSNNKTIVISVVLKSSWQISSVPFQICFDFFFGG